MFVREYAVSPIDQHSIYQGTLDKFVFDLFEDNFEYLAKRLYEIIEDFPQIYNLNVRFGQYCPIFNRYDTKEDYSIEHRCRGPLKIEEFMAYREQRTDLANRVDNVARFMQSAAEAADNKLQFTSLLQYLGVDVVAETGAWEKCEKFFDTAFTEKLEEIRIIITEQKLKNTLIN